MKNNWLFSLCRRAYHYVTGRKTVSKTKQTEPPPKKTVMVVSDGCEYEVPSHYSRTEQVTYIWSKYVLAQIFLAAVQNEDYELCREIKGTFEKHGFDETYSKEELSAEFKEWYGKDEVAAKMTDERFDRIHNAVLEKSFIEAKNFLGLKY